MKARGARLAKTLRRNARKGLLKPEGPHGHSENTCSCDENRNSELVELEELLQYRSEARYLYNHYFEAEPKAQRKSGQSLKSPENQLNPCACKYCSISQKLKEYNENNVTRRKTENEEQRMTSYKKSRHIRGHTKQSPNKDWTNMRMGIKAKKWISNLIRKIKVCCGEKTTKSP